MDLQSDGDLFIGSDVSAPVSTYFSLFATNQTYNGESVEAGDLLIGDNTNTASNYGANLYWNLSGSSFDGRYGTTPVFSVDVDYPVGGNDNAVILAGENVYDQNKTSLIVVAYSAGGASGVVLNSEQLNTGDVVIGRNDASYENVKITSGGVYIREGTTVYGKLTSAIWTIGRDTSTYPNVLIDASSGELQFRRGTTIYGKLDSTSWVLYSESDHNIKITATSIDLRVATTSYLNLSTDAVRVGPTSGERVAITSSGITFYDGSDNDQLVISGTQIVVGDESGGEYLLVDSSGLNLYGGEVQRGAITTTGFWFGDTAVTERLTWDTTDGLRIFDSSAEVMRFPTTGDALIKGTLSLSSPGEISAGAGNVLLDADGIDIDVTTLYENRRAYSLSDSAGTRAVGGFWGSRGGTPFPVNVQLYADNGGVSTATSELFLLAREPTSGSNTGSVRMGIAVSGGPIPNTSMGVSEGPSTNSLGLGWISAGNITFDSVVGINQCKVFINDSVNTATTYGLTINAGSATNELISLKADNIAHGVNETETDTFGALKELISNAGGVVLVGYSDEYRCIRLRGFGQTESTTDTTASSGQINMQAILDTGSGTPGVLGSTGNLFTVRNYTTTRLIIKGNGTMHVASTVQNDADPDSTTVATATALDNYDDIKLLAGARLSHLHPEDELRQRYSEWIDYARPVLEKYKIMFYEGDTPTFYSVQGMQMLTIDAMRQMAAKMSAMESAMLDAGIAVPLLES
jgi:hypothetical protein